MKKTLVLAVACLLLASAPAFAFSFGLSYSSNSGDKDLDMTLSNINREAGADRDGFITDLTVSYGYPRIEIENLVYKYRLPMADVYMTIRIGSLIKQPISVVFGEYKKNKGQGWGVIAKNLGIKPGSPAFHQLKNGASDTLNKAKGRKEAKLKSNNSNKSDKLGKSDNTDKGNSLLASVSTSDSSKGPSQNKGKGNKK